MRILQVLPALNSGGVERGTVDFAREIVKLGHESIVLSNGGRMVGDLEPASVGADVGQKDITGFKRANGCNRQGHFARAEGNLDRKAVKQGYGHPGGSACGRVKPGEDLHEILSPRPDPALRYAQAVVESETF